jgi:hypothetical protein
MGIGRRIWSGVLAFDRVGSRVPRIIQIMVTEYMGGLMAAAFVAKIVQQRGTAACTGGGPPLDMTDWVVLALGLALLGWLLRDVFRPQVLTEIWTPFVQSDALVAWNSRWQVSYAYLTSHPSYSVPMLLPAAAWLALYVMLWDEPCSLLFFKALTLGPLLIWLAMALLRALSWYGLRLGRAELDSQLPEGWSQAKAEWEMAWKPVLGFVGLMLAFLAILGLIIAREQTR